MSPTAERPLRSRRRLLRRVTALLAAAGLTAVLATAQTTGTTEASWTDSEHGAATLTAGTLGPPRTAICRFDDNQFTPTWIAPAAPSVDPAGYQFRLYWDGLLSPERLEFDWTEPTSDTSYTYPLPASILTAGTYRFQVRAASGDWRSTPITGTATVIALLNVVSIDGCSWS